MTTAPSAPGSPSWAWAMCWRSPAPPDPSLGQAANGALRADHIAAALPRGCWHRVSAGTGSSGPRWYDWAWVCAHQPGHSLLIRRGSDGALAFYRCWSPAPVPLATLVHVAGMRWSIEEQFQAAKSQVGLDHYQVRTWTGWHRFTSPWPCSPSPSSWPAPPRAAPPAPADPWHHARHGGPIALTAAEIRRLFNGLVITPLRARLATPAARHQRHPALVHTGAATTKAKPAAATTSTDSPPNSAHNEMTLPY